MGKIIGPEYWRDAQRRRYERERDKRQRAPAARFTLDQLLGPARDDGPGAA